MARDSWLSREVWDGWDWIFGIGFVLLLLVISQIIYFYVSAVELWFAQVLFLLPLILGVALVGLSAYHAQKRYRALKEGE